MLGDLSVLGFTEKSFVEGYILQRHFKLPNFSLIFFNNLGATAANLGQTQTFAKPDARAKNANEPYLSTLGNVREGDLFGGVKHEYATHPRALECSACFSPLNS